MPIFTSIQTSDPFLVDDPSKRSNAVLIMIQLTLEITEIENVFDFEI
jgi:hypothetical protein